MRLASTSHQIERPTWQRSRAGDSLVCGSVEVLMPLDLAVGLLNSIFVERSVDSCRTELSGRRRDGSGVAST